MEFYKGNAVICYFLVASEKPKLSCMRSTGMMTPQHAARRPRRRPRDPNHAPDPVRKKVKLK